VKSCKSAINRGPLSSCCVIHIRLVDSLYFVWCTSLNLTLRESGGLSKKGEGLAQSYLQLLRLGRWRTLRNSKGGRWARRRGSSHCHQKRYVTI